MKKVIVRCPSCGHRNQVEGGDDLHPQHSLKKPDESEVADGSIQETIHDCINTKCFAPFRVYWFQGKGFFEVFNPRR